MNDQNGNPSDAVLARFNSAMDRLTWAQPFLGHILSGLRIRANEAVSTMCVSRCADGWICLEWSPEWVSGLTVEQTVAVLQHEANHIAFGHLNTRREMYPDHRALTIAQETSVNQWCDKGKLPGRPILLEDWPELPHSSSWEERYHLLASKNLEHDPRAAGINWEGMGRSHPGEIMDSGELGRIFRDAVAELGAEEVLKGIPGPQKSQIAKALARHGNQPGNLEEMARVADGRPQIPWERRLRQLAGNLAQPAPSLIRPARRFPGMTGLIPGRGARPRRPRLLAVIDTSGSVTQQDFSVIRRELVGLAESCELTLACCDTKIRSVQRLSKAGLRSETLALAGRGGTDLRPPLAPEFLARTKPRLVVYFTDGHGPIPDAPPATPVVWVLVGERPAAPKWGEVLRIGKGKNNQMN
jgi:predicted metal-dependent peptidase